MRFAIKYTKCSNVLMEGAQVLRVGNGLAFLRRWAGLTCCYRTFMIASREFPQGPSSAPLAPPSTPHLTRANPAAPPLNPNSTISFVLNPGPGEFPIRTTNNNGGYERPLRRPLFAPPLSFYAAALLFTLCVGVFQLQTPVPKLSLNACIILAFS